MSKIKVGVYNFTCCEGCTIVLVESLNKKFDEWMSKIDFVDFRVLKSFKEIHKTDVAFVEGAISTESEVKKLKEIRKKTKKLIAYGAGATIGFPSDQRNNFGPKKLREIEPLLKKYHQIEKVSPLKAFVKVDEEIPGCPVDINVVMAKIEEMAKGK